jgi:PAS domain S-box-containing protein
LITPPQQQELEPEPAVNWITQLFSYPDNAQVLPVSYAPGLVLLSLLIAIFTSSMAIRLAWVARQSTAKQDRWMLLLGSSVALGGGIWAMHFIGMLALHIHTHVSYGPWITGLSMLPGIGASAVAMSILMRQDIGRLQLLVGGVLVGAGIGTMHYSGMAAMQMAPDLRFDPVMFGLSILIAVALAMLALWARFGMQRFLNLAAGDVRLDLIAGSIMGCAITGMHYMGMAAARFVAPPDLALQQTTPSLLLAMTITFITVGLTMMVVIMSGLLKYRQLSKDARGNAERLNAIFGTSIDSIVTTDGQGTILNVNQATEVMFGWPEAQLVGQNIAMLMPPETGAQYIATLKSYLHTGQTSTLGAREADVLTRDGRLLPVHIAVGHTKLPGQDLFVAFVADISQRKQKEREQELMQARDRAEQIAAARTTFVAHMSHEIRTPMNAILGFTDILLTTDLQAQQRKHLNTIHSAAHALLSLLNDILDTAKLEKGKVELSVEPFAMTDLLDAVQSTLWIQAQRKQINLRCDVASALNNWYLGDDVRLRQILLNLVGNAIKFTEQGEVTLQIGPGKQEGWVHFAVRDTGIGIAPERLPHIFDSFTQADASTTRRFGGTGLGTTISKQLVELMGGRIEVSSTLGQGSCFEFEVPLSQTAAVPRPQAALAALQLPRLRLLVADDVLQNRELLSFMLEGHQLTLVGDGQQVLDALTAPQQYDALLLDVHMPVLDGLSAARLIRAREQQQGWPALPIIALTASVQAEDRRAAREAGMDGFCSKPVEKAALLGELLRLLQPAATPAAPAPAAPAPETSLPLLDYAAGLARWGKAKPYQQALERFISQFADELAALAALIAAGDGDAVRNKSHALKGVAANLSLMHSAALLVALEAKSRTASQSELAALLEQLQQLQPAMTQLLSDMPTSETQVAPQGSEGYDPAAVKKGVQTLLQLAARNELDDNCWPALLPVAGPYRQQLQRIEQTLSNFDFADATAQLQQLQAHMESAS